VCTVSERDAADVVGDVEPFEPEVVDESGEDLFLCADRPIERVPSVAVAVPDQIGDDRSKPVFQSGSDPSPAERPGRDSMKENDWVAGSAIPVREVQSVAIDANDGSVLFCRPLVVIHSVSLRKRPLLRVPR
jgi:hypothetical protein